MQLHTHNARRRPSMGAAILGLGLMVGVSGCDSLLEVSNPNNIAGDDVLNPAAAAALANGALSGTARGYANILTSYSTLTDELEWSGSRDAYQTLDFGDMTDPFNEFTDNEYKRFTQGRWMADEAVRVLTIHQGNGELEDEEDLWRSHIYRAIVYMQIGDMYDDFVYSDRQEAGQPIGPANMGTQTYGEAISSLDMVVANSASADNVLAARALRARAAHGLAVWNTIGNGFNPTGGTFPGTVDAGQGAIDDANFVLANGDPDWRWAFEYSSATIGSSIHGWVNSRQEMRIGPAYATPSPTDPTFEAVSLEDLIDVGTVSPELERFILEFSTVASFNSGTPLTIVSAREMHLILAEAALAGNGNANFTTSINALRAIDGLTPFSGQVNERDLLVHHRRTDMYLQGRRLSDHYRFDTPSREWLAASVAVNSPGTFFPLPANECQANENIPDTC